MATDKKVTTIRLSDEDRYMLDRLCGMTGLDSHAAAIRFAVRESVSTREGQQKARKR